MYDKDTQISTAETRERESLPRGICEAKRSNYSTGESTKFRFVFFFSIILGSFLFVGIGQASAATYYVSPTGSNTSPYDTWEKAANLPSTAITAGNTDVGGDGPHVMYIAPGTYADNISIADSDWVNSTIVGTNAYGSTADAVQGQVTLSIATAHPFYTNQTGITVKNLSFTGTNSTHDNMYIVGENFTGVNLYVYNSGRNNVYTSNAIDFSLIRSLFAGAAQHNLSLSGVSNGSITDSVIRNSTQILGGTYGILFSSTGTLDIYNCVVMGTSQYGIFNSSTGTVNLKNSYISGGIGSGSYTPIKNTGTINATNNLLMGTYYDYEIFTGTLPTIDEGNIKTSSPRFKTQLMPGTLVLTIDDHNAIDYVESLESLFASYGVKGTWFVDSLTLETSHPEYIDRINSIISRGIFSVGGHSYSHSNLSLTGDIYTITKADATIDINRTADTITVTPGGTITGFKAKSLATIKTALEGFGCTVGSYPSGLRQDALGEMMADSGGAQGSPYSPQILIDESASTGYFKTEIADSKAFLEANLTSYTGKSFSTPGGSTSSAVEAAVKNSGWLSKRDVTRLPYTLNSINIFEMGVISTMDVIGDTDEATRSAIRDILQTASQYGVLFSLMDHEDNFTLSNWEILLAIARNEFPELLVTDMDTAIDSIRNDGVWTTVDGSIYTRERIDQSDYHLRSTSPAIDAGTSISLTTDYSGNSIYGAPDIGAYEYQPPFTFTANDIPTTGSVRLYSDGKYRMTTASSTADVANFSVTPAEGSYYATTTQYMDITLNTWETTGDKNKEWTATSTAGDFLTHATSTIYTIGDLLPDTYYAFKLDGTASTTAITGYGSTICNTNGSCLSDTNGSLTFTYTGGYSTHTFALTKDTTAPASFSLTTPADKGSIQKGGTLSWSASSDTESGLAPYELYIDNTLITSTTDTSVSVPTTISCSNTHSWYIKALDNNDNSTNSNTQSFTIQCGFSHTYPNVTPVVATPPSTPTPPSTSSSLSSVQIASILSVLTSFGVDADTMAKVQTALTGTPSTIQPQATSFARDLKLNTTGTDVKALQQYLNANGFTLSATGPGSSGNETTFFGPATTAALIRFQKANNITPAVGYFGPVTRAAINSTR
ncbi:MAG: peptidoglycan-binding protein [Candidatus Paceibacterota bacterium]|jgi:hypothetical protein